MKEKWTMLSVNQSDLPLKKLPNNQYIKVLLFLNKAGVNNKISW